MNKPGGAFSGSVCVGWFGTHGGGAGAEVGGGGGRFGCLCAALLLPGECGALWLSWVGRGGRVDTWCEHEGALTRDRLGRACARRSADGCSGCALDTAAVDEVSPVSHQSVEEERSGSLGRPGGPGKDPLQFVRLRICRLKT